MQYKLKADYNNTKKDTVVYKCRYYDYGLSSDDTCSTGIEHMSVTFKADGDYPSFTIPVYLLEKF
jgi:hypothetical protein